MAKNRRYIADIEPPGKWISALPFANANTYQSLLKDDILSQASYCCESYIDGAKLVRMHTRNASRVDSPNHKSVQTCSSRQHESKKISSIVPTRL